MKMKTSKIQQILQQKLLMHSLPIGHKPAKQAENKASVFLQTVISNFFGRSSMEFH